MTNEDEKIKTAAEFIKKSKYLVSFMGAGVSVESGVPAFRGEGGLWTQYDPKVLDIDYFMKYPEKSWPVIIEIFYQYMGKAKPNAAHLILAKWEKKSLLKKIITQNIDNLHYEAGNRNIVEFHGNTRNLICLNCGKVYKVDKKLLENIPPRCSACQSILKPDFVFFGEAIPVEAYSDSIQAAQKCDVLIVIGTTGEVMPANLIPELAKNNGARVIEINPRISEHTQAVTDVFLPMKATEAMIALDEAIYSSSAE